MWSPWGKKSVVNSVKNRNVSSISLYIYHIITLVQYKWSRGRSLSITVTDKAFFIFSKAVQGAGLESVLDRFWPPGPHVWHPCYLEKN